VSFLNMGFGFLEVRFWRGGFGSGGERVRFIGRRVNG